MKNGKKTATRNPGISRLPDGRYRIRATMRIEGGKRLEREQYLPFGTTEAEAVAARAALQIELQRQSSPDGECDGPPDARSTTLSQYSEKWIAGKKLKPRTAERYVDALSTQILPVLGDLSVSSITRMVVEGWVRKMEARRQKSGKPYASETLAGWWRILAELLRDASADYDLPDPTRRVRPPQSKAKAVRDGRALGEDELAQFLGWIKVHQPKHYLDAAFMVLLGCRVGELLELRWSDVDLDAKTVALVRSVSWVRGKGPVVGTTKTSRGRDQALPTVLVDLLRERRAAVDPQADDLVFPATELNKWNTWHRHRQVQLNTLNRAADKAGIKVKVGNQTLRVSYVTNLRAMGHHEAARAGAGHVTQRMSDHYSRPTVSHVQAANDALAARLIDRPAAAQ